MLLLCGKDINRRFFIGFWIEKPYEMNMLNENKDPTKFYI
jgi:hypothetical protein